MAASTYSYKVRDKAGKTVEGSLDADSEELVRAKLREMGMTPVEIKKAGTGLSMEINIPGLSDRVKLKEIAVFSRQFATMINSGLSLLRALNILASQTENKALKEIIKSIARDVEQGVSLSDAMVKHPKAFNDLYIAMIRAGEVGGVLDSVLLKLATTIEKQVELRQRVKSAMTYPVAVLGLVILILTAMLLFVVPMFETLYDDLDGTLPMPTQILLTVSRGFSSFFPFFLVGTGLTVFLIKRWGKTERGRWVLDSIKLKIPVFGVLTHKTAMARFSRTLESLLMAGVPILESLDITTQTVGNVVVAKAVREVQDSVREGEPLAKQLVAQSIFPPMVAQMMAVGEETGALDEMLGKIGQFYEQEIDALVDALTSLLEPLLIVVLGGTVGGMVVALYMPMFNIVNLIE
ncbi:MAG: type II secretion system F family protein [Actinomycetota bacterium]